MYYELYAVAYMWQYRLAFQIRWVLLAESEHD